MGRIKLRSVADIMRDKVKGITSKTGHPINKVLKTGLIEVINEYPDYLKEEKHSSNTYEISIDGLPRKTEKEMRAIAKNLNIPFESFLRGCLFNVIQKYPEEIQDFCPFEDVG